MSDEGGDDAVIIPPPDMRVVVDKTASYIATAGAAFETRLYAKEKSNPKFAFLLPS